MEFYEDLPRVPEVSRRSPLGALGPLEYLQGTLSHTLKVSSEYASYKVPKEHLEFYMVLGALKLEY